MRKIFRFRARYRPRVKPNPQDLWGRHALKIGRYVATFALFRLSMAGAGEIWTLALQHQPEFNYDLQEPGRMFLMDNMTIDEDTTKAQIPALLEHLKKMFTVQHSSSSAPTRSRPCPGTPLTTDESNRLYRDMSIQELSMRLGSDIDGKHLETEHARKWLEFFWREGHNFGTVYAWASRYAAKPKTGSSWIRVYVPRGEERNPLHKSEPSDYNCALSNIRDSVEPYARYMNFTSGERVTGLEHPLRIFPRRVWDLHSNRVIPFDWLVSHEARVESNNVGFITLDTSQESM